MISFLFNFVFGWQSAFAFPPSEAFDIAISEFNKDAQFSLPKLTEAQIAKLQTGKVVTHIEKRQNKPGRAIGMLLTDTDIPTLWTAYRDLHFQQQKSTTEFLLHRTGVDVETWYGYMELPWPVNDRHWIVTSWSNHELARATQNQHWERAWKLNEISHAQVPNQVKDISLPSFIEMESAIYTPVNEGAWAMLTIVDKTLLVYHASTVIGGNIPDNVVAQFIVSTVDEMLMDIHDRARKNIKIHYRAPHSFIYGGDGMPIAPFENNP